MPCKTKPISCAHKRGDTIKSPLMYSPGFNRGSCIWLRNSSKRDHSENEGVDKSLDTRKEMGIEIEEHHPLRCRIQSSFEYFGERSLFLAVLHIKPCSC